MSKKQTIEVRDPLHVFVKLQAAELPVLNSAPFQRLRHIHQLALSYLVYPGATHRRFEHSLGVMELATRIFNVVVDDEHLTDEVREIVPKDPFDREYWRRALRMAALCHDTGHLPFSHAAEKELLPEGADHETLTAQIVRSDEMAPTWKAMKLDPEDIVKLAVEPEDVPGALPPWQAILNEIITGASFGADRMDYLLRDSLHAGVAYGRFDHFRLIDTLRILPPAPADAPSAAETRPSQRLSRAASRSWASSTAAWSPPRRSCWRATSCSPRSTFIGSGASTTSISRTSCRPGWRTGSSRWTSTTTSP